MRRYVLYVLPFLMPLALAGCVVEPEPGPPPPMVAGPPGAIVAAPAPYPYPYYGYAYPEYPPYPYYYGPEVGAVVIGGGGPYHRWR